MHGVLPKSSSTSLGGGVVYVFESYYLLVGFFYPWGYSEKPSPILGFVEMQIPHYRSMELMQFPEQPAANWERTSSFCQRQSEDRKSFGCFENSSWSLSPDSFYAHEHTAIIKQNSGICMHLRRWLEPGFHTTLFKIPSSLWETDNLP